MAKTNQLEGLYLDLLQKRLEGVVNEIGFMSCCLVLADMNLQDNQHTEAMRLVSLCTPQYFKQVLPRLVENDDQLKHVVTHLASHLVDAGLVSPEADVDETLVSLINSSGRPS